jgi:hypothetical protein
MRPPRRPRRTLRMVLSRSTMSLTLSVFNRPSSTRSHFSAILRVCQKGFVCTDNLLIITGYMKKVKETLKEKGASEDTVKEFEKGAAAYAKKIVGNFKDYDFYVGESMDPDGMVVLMNYREDGVTPFVTIWKHGLSEMKV